MEIPYPVPPAFKRNWPLFASGAVAILALAIFAAHPLWEGLTFGISMTNVANLLAPLAFAAAVTERAVEILISPWRDTGANKLQAALAAAQTVSSSVASSSDAATKASDALNEYRGETQRCAFAISVVLSLCVSIAGIRAFQPFLVSTSFDTLKNAHPHQHAFFMAVDVALTTALLAGGADGVHSM